MNLGIKNKLSFPDVLVFSLVSLPIIQATLTIGEDVVQHQGFPAVYGLMGVIFGALIYLIIYEWMCVYITFPVMMAFWLLRAYIGSRALAFMISATCASALLVYGPFTAQSNMHEIRFSLPACIFAIMAHELFYLRKLSRNHH